MPPIHQTENAWPGQCAKRPIGRTPVSMSHELQDDLEANCSIHIDLLGCGFTFMRIEFVANECVEEYRMCDGDLAGLPPRLARTCRGIHDGHGGVKEEPRSGVGLVSGSLLPCGDRH